MTQPRISSQCAREAIAALVDDFHEMDGPISDDPLDWPGYGDQLRRARQLSGEEEAVVAGHARLDGEPLMLIATDFRFMGGSMGAATGARIVKALEEARLARCPVVSLIASGGARIQEGMCSLVQMQRVAAAHADARREGVAHVAVLRHPATGGVWAALGSVADIVYALPDAMVAFSGPRVRGTEIHGRCEPEFTGAGQHRHGAVDRVLGEAELREEVALAVSLLRPSRAGTLHPADVPGALAAEAEGVAASAWEHVLQARHSSRPRAARYLDAYFEARLAMSGDRAGATDPEMLCGFGRRKGRTIAYAAQTGTRNVPAGFRTAARLLELAARLRLPVLTLIDTPGAANDAVAERGAIGTAIGEVFQRVAASPAPVTSLVIGEGGSGAALALASPDRLWITPDAYFSVIAPEGAAAILRRDVSQAPEMAERMCLRPEELLRLGVVKGIARGDSRPA
jgi:acetyl-CoA carboxylase carboxyl transferase subunit beta